MKLNNCRGELTDISANKEALVPWTCTLDTHLAHTPWILVLLFSKLNKFFFGYFEPEKIFFK